MAFSESFGILRRIKLFLHRTVSHLHVIRLDGWLEHVKTLSRSLTVSGWGTVRAKARASGPSRFDDSEQGRERCAIFALTVKHLHRSINSLLNRSAIFKA